MFKLLALFMILISGVSAPLAKPEIIATPIPLFVNQIQNQYQAPVSEYAAGHRGIDFGLPIDNSIQAPVSGSIRFKGLVVDRDVVTIQSSDGKLFSFEPACTRLKVSETVNEGEPFASHCSPKSNYKYHCDSCVHYSVRTNFGYLSPMYFYGQLHPSRLRA
jgi:hypothetical protein